ncbi:D-arabinono-1,4-lactone oxidase [Colletotrichum higginsianum IMI 349063]|uniref:D-arabinono-1,4-lactone oxidase n=2 Tax=Colletotrichum higginsianum TaxID=80884 RepID=A0A1B7Y904_COLHI|nr:D-arabinono-1,4-lactone oxidase [Colletotrichum higginsianum IMI 349063]OBR08460.1 D-arabinono-1,4-lactone oxidase [Colletotrichum higginsianum IMI 349063]TIC95785.1 putative D-arabinono-1,4-lactone oxidase [Colletotrichum higginsianum]
MDPAIAALLEKSAADGIPFRARANHVVDLARRHRRRLVTVGCGHSAFHITCTSSWQLNLDHYARVLSTDASTGLAVVQSGIRLHSLCDELDRRGLAMPNLGSINQ